MNSFQSSDLSTASANEGLSVRILQLGGRTLMGAFFVVSGVRKLMAWGATVTYFGNLGLPVPELAAVGVISIEIGGALLLILGWRIYAVALALGIFTLSAALIGHQFWNADPAQINNQVNHFLKVLGVLGGLLHIAAYSGRQSELGG